MPSIEFYDDLKLLLFYPVLMLILSISSIKNSDIPNALSNAFYVTYLFSFSSKHSLQQTPPLLLIVDSLFCICTLFDLDVSGIYSVVMLCPQF